MKTMMQSRSAGFSAAIAAVAALAFCATLGGSQAVRAQYFEILSPPGQDMVLVPAKAVQTLEQRVIFLEETVAALTEVLAAHRHPSAVRFRRQRRRDLHYQAAARCSPDATGTGKAQRAAGDAGSERFPSRGAGRACRKRAGTAVRRIDAPWRKKTCCPDRTLITPGRWCPHPTARSPAPRCFRIRRWRSTRNRWSGPTIEDRCLKRCNPVSRGCSLGGAQRRLSAWPALGSYAVSSARTWALIELSGSLDPWSSRAKVSIGCPSQRSTSLLSNKKPLRSLVKPCARFLRKFAMPFSDRGIAGRAEGRR